MKYIYRPTDADSDALEPIELNPASMEVLLDPWGQMPEPPYAAFLERVNGKPWRLLTTKQVELVAEEGEVWTTSSPYPVKVEAKATPVEPLNFGPCHHDGLGELQQEAVREIVQELLTEANRKLVEQLRRPLIPT